MIIGSHAAHHAFTDCAGYTAAKAGQLGLVRVLAEEARPYDIRVTALLARRDRHADLGRPARASIAAR